MKTPKLYPAPRLGWDENGTPYRTGIAEVDTLLFEIDLTSTEAIEAYSSKVVTRFGDPMTQRRNQIVAFLDGLVIKRRPAHNAVWACVAWRGEDPLTVTDAALVIGVKYGTLNSWLWDGRPRGNPFPEPTWHTALSSQSPIRLWDRWTVIDWYLRRPGRGHRSDRSM